MRDSVQQTPLGLVHDREFLFKFACDRNHYRQLLWHSAGEFLNMVRAGVVAHPAQWPWCSYSEWMGQRRRYGVVDRKESLRVLGGASLAEFRANYDALINTRLAKDVMAREPQWTESIAVGSRAFVEAVGQTVRQRSGSTIPRLGRVFGCCARIGRCPSGKGLRSNNDRVKIVAKTIQRPLGHT